MDHGALLAQAEPGGHRQHDGHGLYQERPLAQVASDDETRQDGLDLWGATGLVTNLIFLDFDI